MIQGNLKWLNSMRALGVTLVLVYHFFPEFLPGGFIGVDIFFVVSGYLITALLLREADDTGRIRLTAFLKRRFRRLFPAILTMLLTTIPLSLLISPDFRVGVGRQAAAVLSWMTNWYEVLTGQSYEAQLLPHLYIHTWTLAVEMQYYILWGAVVTLIALIFNKRKIRRIGILTSAILLSAASLIIMNVLSAGAEDPSAAYMATPSHLYPLMIGSFFACLGGFHPLRALAVLAKHKAFLPISMALACLGVATFVWMSFAYSFDDPRVYSYGLFVLSAITGLILLLAGLHQAAIAGTKASKPEWAISNYVGLRSYSIYLYHWPVMIILRQLASGLRADALGGKAVLIATIIAIPITFIAAELSYRFIEQKFRTRRATTPAVKPAKVRPIAICAVALILAVISADAISTAPKISSIEADLKYGAMKLDVRQLKDLHNE